MNDGFRTLLFGILLGTTDYFAGNVTKGIVQNVMASLGYNEHVYTNLDNKTIETTTMSDSGITMKSE